jgi:hypothetical protein
VTGPGRVDSQPNNPRREEAAEKVIADSLAQRCFLAFEI